MADSYDAALTQLYQAPFASFVAERKRLAAELKAAGDKDAAARLGKLGRPSVSAWAVNQLWWQAQGDFDALLEAAARVRGGDRDAAKAHKDVLAKLRDRAATLLNDAGNAATETTLRRVATTLSALAVNGGFDPDPPGALVADRDPPGFEALGESTAPVVPPSNEALARAREAEAQKQKAEADERKRRLEERERLSTTLREAMALRETQQREVTRARGALDSAEQDLKKTSALMAEIEAKLAALSGG